MPSCKKCAPSPGIAHLLLSMLMHRFHPESQFFFPMVKLVMIDHGFQQVPTQPFFPGNCVIGQPQSIAKDHEQRCVPQIARDSVVVVVAVVVVVFVFVFSNLTTTIYQPVELLQVRSDSGSSKGKTTTGQNNAVCVLLLPL